MSSLVGNLSLATPALIGAGTEHAPFGFRGYIYQGTARVDTTGRTALDILDQDGNTPTFQATANDPIWIAHASFGIPLPIVATNGDQLKLAVSLADTAGYVVNNSAAASSQMPSQYAAAAIAPGSPVQITTNVAFRLFLHNGSNTTPGGTISVASGFRRLPVRIVYIRRMAPVDLSDVILSAAQQRLDAGL